MIEPARLFEPPPRRLLALAGEVEQVLGHLVFYSVPNAHVSHVRLVGEWSARGLSRALLPRPPSALGTFRAATSALERRGEGTEIRAELAHRSAAACAIQLTGVVRDPAGRVVEHPKLARLTLERAREVIRYERLGALPGAEPEWLCARARLLYRAWRAKVPGGALRRLVRAQLLALGASAVRESGGVYFVPVAARHDLAEMAGALEALTDGRGELHRIPLADDASQRAMVRRHFVANCSTALDAEIARLRRLIGGGAGEDALTSGLRERRRLGALKARYAGILHDELAELEVRMEALDGQLARLAGAPGATNGNRIASPTSGADDTTREENDG